MTSHFLTPDNTWLRTAPAAVAIGFSPRTLSRRIGDGILVSGTHFIKSGPSKSSWYLFNVPECRKALGNGGQS